MLLIKRAVSSSKGVRQFQLYRKNYIQVLSPMSYNITVKKFDAEDFHFRSTFSECIRRSLHVTKVNRDIETGLRGIGAGIAACGTTGSGIGLGIIFGNLLSAIGRNPTAAEKTFTNAILGAAFCEALGLMSVAVAFMLTI